MKLYGAIDLHSNNNVTVLIDEKDKVVYQKRLANDLRLVIEQLSPYASSMEGIVVESTYNWYWLVDGLMEKGHRVHLAERESQRICDPKPWTRRGTDSFLGQANLPGAGE
jgi:transposase